MEWGSPRKHLKSLAYPAIAIGIGGSLMGLLWSLAGGNRSPLSWESAAPSSNERDWNPETTLPSTTPISPEVLPPSVRESLPSSSPDPSSQTSHPATATTTQVAIAPATAQGNLRVRNQTDHPVRLAVILKRSPIAQRKDQNATSYSEPAHWDFAPMEGSQRGLTLSLPEGRLKLKKGDIVVAFAQDGSRRYWGPFVVGETSIPRWNAKSVEWSLTLEP